MNPFRSFSSLLPIGYRNRSVTAAERGVDTASMGYDDQRNGIIFCLLNSQTVKRRKRRPPAIGYRLLAIDY